MDLTRLSLRHWYKKIDLTIVIQQGGSFQKTLIPKELTEKNFPSNFENYKEVKKGTNQKSINDCKSEIYYSDQDLNEQYKKYYKDFEVNIILV